MLRVVRSNLSHTLAAAATALGVLVVAQPSLSIAKSRQECRAECAELRQECRGSCQAGFRDCLRPAREQTKACVAGCAETFADGSEELRACAEQCIEELLVPARLDCGEQRRACKSECRPDDCVLTCVADDGGANACVADCALGFRECARAGREEIRACLKEAGCNHESTAEEKVVCAETCAETAVLAHQQCRDDFAECVGICADPGEPIE